MRRTGRTASRKLRTVERVALELELSEAITSPLRLRIGTAADIRPSSNSPSTNANPRWRVVRTAPKHVNWPDVRDAIAQLSKKLDIAEARLQTRSFICGDELTLADVQLGHVLYRYFDIAIERPEHRALKRYYDRLSTRAAFREHVMVSYDELRAA